MATATAKKTSTTAKPAAKSAAKASTTKAAPAKKPAAQKAPKEQAEPFAPIPTSLREALTSGASVLMKVRANGTRRSLPYLAVGTNERTAAETVAARRAKDETIPAIAEDLKVSVATARRFLTNLQNSQDVEAGKHDALWTPETKQVIIHTVTAK